MDNDGTNGRTAEPFVIERRSDGTVLRLEGDIDAVVAAPLRAAMAEVLDEQPALLRVDMAGVDFIDSVGISVLVATYNRATERDVAFEVAAVPAVCLRVFEITRLTDVFTIVP